MRAITAALLATAATFGSVGAQTYDLHVTIQEVGTIGTALGDRPFREASPLIQKLEAQIKEQDAARKAADKPADPAPAK